MPTDNMTLTQIAQSFHVWFAERNIDPASLTVILNVSDRHDAARIDVAVAREFYDITKLSIGGTPIATTDFQLHGIRFKIESPLHELSE